MSKYRFYYFDSKALGESSRLLLAYGGQEFEDIRFSDEEWPAIKPKIQAGRVPTLEIDGKQYWQSKALSRFLGRKYGLDGDTPEESLEIDQIVDFLVELRTKAEETNWRFEPNEEVREKRFANYAKNVFPEYLERLNAVAVKNNGHLALGKLTWADFILTGIFDYLKNLVRIPDLDKKYPAFKQIIDNVYSYPQVKAYADAAPYADE